MMMTSATFSTKVLVILVVFSLCLCCLAKSKKKRRQVHAEINWGVNGNGTANWNSSDEERCDPVSHGFGRGGMKCLGCRYSADPAPKNCLEKKVYECFQGEVCVTRLQKSADSGKGHIEKGCTTMFQNKEFNKWVNIRTTAMGDIQTQEMLCNETDCCNGSDDPYDAVESFKASLLITVIMFMLTAFSKSMFND